MKTNRSYCPLSPQHSVKTAFYHCKAAKLESFSLRTLCYIWSYKQKNRSASPHPRELDGLVTVYRLVSLEYSSTLLLPRSHAYDSCRTPIAADLELCWLITLSIYTSLTPSKVLSLLSIRMGAHDFKIGVKYLAISSDNRLRATILIKSEFFNPCSFTVAFTTTISHFLRGNARAGPQAIP